MQKLTEEFIESIGFKKEEKIIEEDFYYQAYNNKSLSMNITIWFNYFNDGRVTNEVEFEGYEFCLVGKEELITLLRIIPKV